MFGDRSFEEETRDMIEELPRGFLLIDANDSVFFEDQESPRKEETEYTRKHVEAARKQGLIELDLIRTASHPKRYLVYKPDWRTPKFQDWQI